MKIEYRHHQGEFQPGDTADVDEAQGKILIRAGVAVAADGDETSSEAGAFQDGGHDEDGL